MEPSSDNSTPPWAGLPAAWTVACRDEHLKQIGCPNTWSALEWIGVRGIEIAVDVEGCCPHLFGGADYSLATADGVARLEQTLREHDVVITALCLLNEFDNRPDQEVDFVGRMVDVAVRLGIPSIRLDFLPRRLKERYDEFLALSIDVGRRFVARTDDAPVRFGVENHVTTTNRIDFLRSLFAGVESPKFGLTLDTANFYWFGHPLSKLYEIYAEFASCACHTHCKNIGYPEAQRERQRPMGWEYARYACPVDRGDIDFCRVAAILRDAGYRGDLCIENESLGRLSPDQRRETLTREASFLRRIVAETVGSTP
ncbi:MAG: sugar phosphate isomerase/epimerase [Planctomycetes bacterium]|nr:sugar phosphate isomerase/epimerase [Planctomycetota bacterium]